MFVSRRAFACGFASTLVTVAQRAVASEEPGTTWQRLSLTHDTWPSGAALGCMPRELARRRQSLRPLAVFLHGYGQAKSARRALNAWRYEYGLARAYERLMHPPVRPVFERAGMLTAQREEQINEALERRPFAGCAAVCPVTPIAYPIEQVGPKFAAWLASDLLVAARQALWTSGRSEATAVAGVSMGGLLALEAALAVPVEFGAVVGIQSHLDDRAAVRFAERFDHQAQQHKPIHVFVLTSEFDVYRSANERLHAELDKRRLPCDLRVTPGNHTAGWVYEVGALETLLWMEDWFCARLPAPESRLAEVAIST